MIRKILWTGLILVVICLVYQSWLLQKVPPFHEGIFQLEFGSCIHGPQLLASWNALCYGRHSYLHIAVQNTHLDFLFIFLYTSLIWMLSYLQMQRDRSIFWNELLRANIIIGLVAALLDCLENVFLLYDFRHAGEAGRYISTYWVSFIKWVFVGWAVLVYLVSLARTQMFGK